MTPGEKVVAAAQKYLGVHERPYGSNTGSPQPNGWQAKPWGLSAVPWCGCYASAMYREAKVDDEGIGHPATQTMYDTAVAKRAVISHPVVGCYFVYPGIHTGIVTQVLSGNRVGTIEGNTADSVGTHVRAFGPGTGLYFLAPKALRGAAQVPPPPAMEFWIENTSAQPILRGPWRLKAVRDFNLKKLPPARRKAARPVRIGKKFAFLEGPRRMFGPWPTSAARDNALKSLKKNRPGGAFRTFSKRHVDTTPADSLGKTT